MNLQDLKTPCLVLDVERVRRNAARVSETARLNNVRLRPHIKTHKCVEVARIQTEGQTGALTVSTLFEAEAFARHGFADFTYAVPIEPGKFAAVTDLLRRGVQLNVITDSVDIPAQLNDAAQAAGVTVPVFLKVDCGAHRCGVGPDTDEAVEIPRSIAAASNLEFAGILTHAGQSYDAHSTDEVAAVARHERDSMVELAERLRRDSLEVKTVSIGSTPTIEHIDHLRGVDEIRPGNYILFDAFQATLGSCGFTDCALTVLAAVIHRDRARRKVVIDAGAIALSKDRGPVGLDAGCGYGLVLDLAGNDLGARVTSLSQEHGVFEVASDAALDSLKVGSRVRVLANHSCLTAAQHDYFHILDRGQIVDRWEIHRGW